MASFNFQISRAIYGPQTYGFEVVYNKEIGREDVTYIVAVYPGRNDIITFTRGRDSRTFVVVEDREFTYKVQKSRLKAKGGAEWLFKYLQGDAFKQFAPGYDAAKLIDMVFRNTRSK